MSNEIATPYFEIFKKLEKVDKKAREEISFGVPNGVYCTDLAEEYASRNPAPCEINRTGKHGQFLVFGRDRTGTLFEGAGAVGLERAGMIDIYVGPASAAETKKKKLNKSNAIDPSFTTDASRIYITQTNLNIDEAFGIENSGHGASSYKKSAVVVKSDQVRVISREKMVLYCGRAASINNADKHGERNSNNEKIVEPPRIEFLTGETKELHPVVLGNNLVKYLQSREEAHNKLINDIENLNEQLTQINLALAIITVGAPPFSKNVLQGVINILENVSDSFNTYIGSINSLDSGLVPGSDSILSTTVFTS
tara:strand:+ start:947 stop:1876 length:930 start_codon:yes stop_codon:yes gene_type:complete